MMLQVIGYYTHPAQKASFLVTVILSNNVNYKYSNYLLFGFTFEAVETSNSLCDNGGTQLLLMKSFIKKIWRRRKNRLYFSYQF